MKYVIDIIDDIREAIHNEGDFRMGVIALEKELDADGNSTMAWAKAVEKIELSQESKELIISLGDTPLHVQTFLDSAKSYSNEAMMYEAVVLFEGSKKELVGFSENISQKGYFLLIEE